MLPTPTPALLLGPRRSGPTGGGTPRRCTPGPLCLLGPGASAAFRRALALCAFWRKLPGAPPRPNGWPRAGKRHTTPPGCPARPKRAPRLYTRGRGGLACQPSGCAALCCSSGGRLPRRPAPPAASGGGGASASKVGPGKRPLYDGGPFARGRFENARADGAPPLRCCQLLGPSKRRRACLAHGARMGWRLASPAPSRAAHKGNFYLPIWGPQAPSPQTKGAAPRGRPFPVYRFLTSCRTSLASSLSDST